MGLVSHVFTYADAPGCQGFLTVKLPPCVDVNYWIRHSLVRTEVENLCNVVPTQLVWCAYMFSGMDLPWYAIKPTAASSFDLALTSKSMAIKHIAAPFRDVNPVILEEERSRLAGHSPSIPLHYIHPDLFNWARTKVASHLLPLQLLAPGEEVAIIPDTFSFLGLTWMVVSLDGEDMITCNACQPYCETECLDLLGHTSLAHSPKVGSWNGSLYMLTEECIFLKNDLNSITLPPFSPSKIELSAVPTPVSSSPGC
jgi:hypothetical protein